MSGMQGRTCAHVPPATVQKACRTPYPLFAVWHCRHPLTPALSPLQPCYHRAPAPEPRPPHARPHPLQAYAYRQMELEDSLASELHAALLVVLQPTPYSLASASNPIRVTSRDTASMAGLAVHGNGAALAEGRRLTGWPGPAGPHHVDGLRLLPGIAKEPPLTGLVRAAECGRAGARVVGHPLVPLVAFGFVCAGCEGTPVRHAAFPTC